MSFVKLPPGTPAKPAGPARRARAAELKTTIAHERVMGATIAEICARHELGRRRAIRLLESRECQEEIEQFRNRTYEAGSRAVFKFLLNADRIADGMIDTALDPTDKNHHDARKFILGHVLPQQHKHAGDVNVSVSMPNNVVIQLAEAVQGANRAFGQAGGPPDEPPRVIEGREALPDYELPTGAEALAQLETTPSLDARHEGEPVGIHEEGTASPVNGHDPAESGADDDSDEDWA